MVGCLQHVGRLSMMYRCSKSFSVSAISLLKRQLSCLIRSELVSAKWSKLFRSISISCKSKSYFEQGGTGLFETPDLRGKKLVIREKSSILVVIRELIASPGARFSKLPKLSGSISGAVISYVSQRRRRF